MQVIEECCPPRDEERYHKIKWRITMELPKFNETFNPILDILSDGQIIHRSELLKRVEDKYYSKLPKELLEMKTKSGEILIRNRIAWGKSYLKKGGFVHYPKRGMVQITQKGKETLFNKLELKDVTSDFLNFYTEENDKNSNTKEIKSSTPQDLLDTGFSAIEIQTKNELFDKLKELDPFYFEKIILILLNKMGYGDFIETSKTGDEGIDGIINKRYNENKVREKDIRNFIGAMSGDTSKGVFVTTSIFDELAIKKAHDAHHKIILIDGKKLVDLMYQYNIGVQIKNVYEVKEVDEDFFEEN
jgi:restriction system protein